LIDVEDVREIIERDFKLENLEIWYGFPTLKILESYGKPHWNPFANNLI
jgi:hypothetical protein